MIAYTRTRSSTHPAVTPDIPDNPQENKTEKNTIPSETDQTTDNQLNRRPPPPHQKNMCILGKE